MSKLPIKLGAVQTTLLIPLCARALETEKDNGLISDPKSLEMMQTIDYDFSNWLIAKEISFVAVRSLMFDENVCQFLQQFPNGTIIEIGCGLNTRFERLDNGSAQWFDIDLPDVIVLRKQFFKDQTRRTTITASALDTSWFDIIKRSPPPYCFVSEAVFLYLGNNGAEQAITQITQAFPDSWLIFDTVTRYLVENQHKNELFKHLSQESWFSWICENPKEVEDWTNEKFKLTSSRSFMNASADVWNKLPLPLWIIWKFLPWLGNVLMGGYRFNIMKSKVLL